MRDAVLFSTSEESFDLAARELRDAFPGLKIARLGPDLGALTGQSVEAVVARCENDPLVFIRHLTVEVARARKDFGAMAVSVMRAAGPATTEIAVQAWASGEPRLGRGAADVASELVRSLRDAGYAPTRAGASHTLSACLCDDVVVFGVNRRDRSLCDWPGGRVRLARRRDQISRSEFKLEELFDVFDLKLPRGGRALDLGAAPGGWTRTLRAHGVRVCAVDPGDLDPRLRSDRSIQHERTTAGEFLRADRSMFDLVVNDMRMEPLRSCRLMADAAAHLSPGGLGVITLKTARRPLETVRECLDALSGAYQVIHARQLHHNRHEVTVVLRVRIRAVRPDRRTDRGTPPDGRR